jgi:hypothetical protein
MRGVLPSARGKSLGEGNLGKTRIPRLNIFLLGRERAYKQPPRRRATNRALFASPREGRG